MNFLEEPVLIKDFPIPPSDNALKKPARRYAKGARRGDPKVLIFVDSDKYIAYRSAVNLWWALYNRAGNDHFKKIRCWVMSGKVLGIVCDLRLHHDVLWTVAGKPQRYDAPNRLKALHDTFSKLVGFDDKMFSKTIIEKVEIPPSMPECFYLTIGPISPRKEQHEANKNNG